MAAKCISMYTSRLIHNILRHFPAKFSSKHLQKTVWKYSWPYGRHQLSDQYPRLPIEGDILASGNLCQFYWKKRYNIKGKNKECAIRIYLIYYNELIAKYRHPGGLELTFTHVFSELCLVENKHVTCVMLSFFNLELVNNYTILSNVSGFSETNTKHKTRVNRSHIGSISLLQQPYKLGDFITAVYIYISIYIYKRSQPFARRHLHRYYWYCYNRCYSVQAGYCLQLNVQLTSVLAMVVVVGSALPVKGAKGRALLLWIRKEDLAPPSLNKVLKQRYVINISLKYDIIGMFNTFLP